MTTRPIAARRAAAALLLALAAGASAHDGHDHGDAAPGAPAAGGPRFAVATDLFELVGALDGRRLVLWLDRSEDTSPVVGARLELDVGGRSVAVRPEGDAYVAMLDAPPPPGVLPIAATVVAGDDADVLAAELRIEPPAPAPGGSAGDAASARASADATGAVRLAAVAAGAALVAGAIGWRAGRRRRAVAGEGVR